MDLHDIRERFGEAMSARVEAAGDEAWEAIEIGIVLGVRCSWTHIRCREEAAKIFSLGEHDGIVLAERVIMNAGLWPERSPKGLIAWRVRP